jgi:RNA polymerase sigma factor (TIGR02999 family)
MAEITRFLNSVGGEDLMVVVYDELRRLAASRMAREQPGHTLQPTALVHEAWLRLAAADGNRWQSRAHFFGAAAEAMRRILVDNARRKAQLKRGGNPERVELPESQILAPEGDDKVLQVHAVLDELAAEDPLKAEIVKLRFFVGLNHQEIADALELNEKTVRRHWEVAKVRLFQLVTRDQSR